MISKDKIIEIIERMHNDCRSTRCEECKFFTYDAKEWCCELNEFTRLFKGSPSVWNVKKIKELL